MFRDFFFRLVAPVFFRSSPARRSPAAPFSRGGDLLLEHVHDRLLPAVHRRAHRRDLRLRVAEHLPPRRGGVPAALGDDGLVARLSRRAIRRDLGVRLRLGLAQARGFLCGISRKGSGGGRSGSGRGDAGEARRGGGKGVGGERRPRDRGARGISPGAGEPGAIAVRAPSLAAVTMACASCSAVRSFWMPSRESIAPERLARNDRASLAGGGGVCCCALGRAVRKSGERGGVGASEARRGSSMDSLRPFLGGSPSRSRNEPPRMQRTRGARVESGGGGNGGRLLGVGSVCLAAGRPDETFFQSRLSAPVD
jgi:hypothetical protein